MLRLGFPSYELDDTGWFGSTMGIKELLTNSWKLNKLDLVMVKSSDDEKNS